MSWLSALGLLLQLVKYFIGKAHDSRLVDEAQSKSLREYADALDAKIAQIAALRSDIMSGRVRVDPASDPYNRDNHEGEGL